jgi:hypothetical protein
MKDRAATGRGILEALNGSSLDADLIVIQASSGRKVRRIFIPRNDSFKLTHLEPGDYRVIFDTGIDWDESNKRFKCEASYFAFGKVLGFKETEEEDRIVYSEHTITLNVVPDGNVKAVPISEAEFLTAAKDAP